MRLIDKYLSKIIFFSTVSIVSILTFIILITQSFKYIDLVVSYGSKTSDFLYLSLLLLPSLLFVIAPICLFIAIMYSLNKLYAQRELNILKSIGLSNLAIAKPIIKVAICITLLHFFLSLYLLPLLNSNFKELTKDIKENYINFFLQERVFNHPTKFITFYIRNKINDNEFENVFYHDARNQNSITLVAQKGSLVKKDNKIFLNLSKGNRQEISPNNDFNILNFDTLWIELDFNKKGILSRNKTVQEKSIIELISPPKDLDKDSKIRGYAEASNRLIWPFYNIILCLVALYTFLEGEFSRSGKLKRMIKSSLSASLIIIINNGLINLAADHSIVIFIDLLYTFFISWSLYYLTFQKNA